MRGTTWNLSGYALAGLISLLPFAVKAGGNGVDNGGDAVAARFVLYGTSHLLPMLNLPENSGLLQPREKIELQKAIDSTIVSAVITNEPFLSAAGNEVEARMVIRDGMNQIELDRKKIESTFDKARTCAGHKDTLVIVFHEYLRAAGIDDQQYKRSNKLLLPPESCKALDLPLYPRWQNYATPEELVHFEKCDDKGHVLENAMHMVETLHIVGENSLPISALNCLKTMETIDEDNLISGLYNLRQRLLATAGVRAKTGEWPAALVFPILRDHFLNKPGFRLHLFFAETAATSLAMIKSRDVDTLFLETLATSTSQRLRELSAMNLGERRVVAAVPALAKALHSDPDLGAFATATTFPDRVRYMETEPPGQVRCEAAKALGQIGSEVALSFLRSAVVGRSDYFDLRIAYKAGDEPLMPSVVYCVTAALLKNQDLSTLNHLRDVLDRWDTHFSLRHLDTVLDRFVEESHSPETTRLLKNFLEAELDNRRFVFGRNAEFYSLFDQRDWMHLITETFPHSGKVFQQQLEKTLERIERENL
ncbi:MAG: HEAT repeat domain-containing protein [Deltaproteobacteria bacterium]|jgi:HEAT repeat protein|nr:HEAT repeat domain-containing protein [Deltaproteobacteria bacterium]